MKQYSINDIKCHNKTAGYHFFDESTMKFFKSRVLDSVFQGDKGIFFVTSEKNTSLSTRLYTVREYNPKTGNVNTFRDFNKLTKYRALKLAEKASKGIQIEYT